MKLVAQRSRPATERVGGQIGIMEVCMPEIIPPFQVIFFLSPVICELFFWFIGPVGKNEPLIMSYLLLRPLAL